MKLRVWKRPWINSAGNASGYAWHWWCFCCVGGDWFDTWPEAVSAALAHAESHRLRPQTFAEAYKIFDDARREELAR